MDLKKKNLYTERMMTMKVKKTDSVEVPMLTDEKFDKIEEFAALRNQSRNGC